MSINEEHIFKEISTDKQKAFEIIFRKYYESLCRYASSFRLDKSECEELVQELFFKIWQNRKSISITNSVSSYLYSSLRNMIINKVKHEKIKSEYAAYKKHTSDNIYINNETETSELEILINKSIEDLPTECKKVFKLSRYEGLKYREIAQQLNISEKTVENQIIKALQRLRTVLSNYLPYVLIIIVLNNIELYTSPIGVNVF